MTLKIAQVAETITVSGDSPIVDTKATGTATNFTADELTKIPTSRDPFSLMRSVPGVLRRSRQHRRQRNRPAVRTSSRRARARRTRSGRSTASTSPTWPRPARRRRYFNFDNFEEIQVVDRRPGHQAADRRHGPQPRRQARHQPVPRRRPRLLRQRRDGVVERAGRARGGRRHAATRPITTSRSPTTASTSADRSCADKAWFYGVVLAAGHPARAPRRRARRPRRS